MSSVRQRWMSKEYITAARRENLYDFLLSRHPDRVKREGNSLRLIGNHSISVKRGYAGYRDFANDETGNSVDFLVRYLGYSLQDAVCALLGDRKPLRAFQPSGHRNIPPKAFEPPTAFSGRFKRLFSYLGNVRGIPVSVIRRLVDLKVIYQEAVHHNIVFLNPEQTLAELRGTSFDPNRSFHGIVGGSDYRAFWWFKTHDLNSVPEVAYVCESAIDAISVYCFHQATGYTANVIYCSIVGVANQQRINAIKAHVPTVLAVDNDVAGQACRDRNPDCESVIPIHKDWNEDWIAYTKKQERA